MSKLSLFAASLLATFLISSPVQSAIYTIQPDEAASKDTIAYEFLANMPLEAGFSGTLGVSNTSTPHNLMSFLQFDLSSLAGVTASQVNSATLKLQTQSNSLGGANPSAAFPVTANLFAASSAWVEAALTWNTRPSAGAMYASAMIDSSNELVEFDITPLVKGWIDGSILNFGVRLEQDAEVIDGSLRVGAAFVSASGAASSRPLLEINTVPEPAAVTLVLIGSFALAAFRRRFAA